MIRLIHSHPHIASLASNNQPSKKSEEKNKMVARAHGTAKKRRSGKSKIRQKQPLPLQIKIAHGLSNPELKAKYDKKLTPVQLMAAAGLVTDSNSDLKGKAKAMKGSAFLGFANILEAGDGFKDQNPNSKPMSDYDANFAQKNIDKHGSNYKKMERDIVTNDRQWSETKMETLCRKYLTMVTKDTKL